MSGAAAPARRLRRRLIAAALLLAGAAGAGATSLRYCDEPPQADPTRQDRMLRLAALVRAELEAGGARVALVSRTGIDLSHIGQRHSHAGFALREHPFAPWAVRQLYYACEERRPRLFDQGLAGFVLGSGDERTGSISLLLLPEAAAQPLEHQVLRPAAALALLGGEYSANAHAFSTRYQNCNQWIAETFAAAWGAPLGGPAPRVDAQQWLREAGYRPAGVKVSPALLLAGVLLPWVHRDDHPQADLEAGRLHVSLPASLEDFAIARWPGARRIELCHQGRRVWIRRGGAPFDADCAAAAGDDERLID